jgi:streptogramin lyase
LNTRAVYALVGLILIIVAGFATYEAYLAPTPSQCAPIAGGTFVKNQLANTTFGAVTEWTLPSQGRSPDAITTAPDGSVWFAEEEVPGVAHLYPGNGTLVEYAWPGYPTPKAPDCIISASTSGIALWDGKVWAADQFADVVWGLNPADGTTVRVNTTLNAAYPYWLAVGSGSLWFTSDNITQFPPRLGRIYPNLTLSIVNLIGTTKYDEPIQLDMVNSTLALFSTVNLSMNSTTDQCVCTGHVYSFDPATSSINITVSTVGGGYKLIEPASVSYADGVVWVTQHGPSSVVAYDLATGNWTNYPTSLVPWSDTLPYVIYANGSTVWFNEHYADKIAVLDYQKGTLTEYSESDPPAMNATGIQNDVSIAPAEDGLWFTSLSGNYVGYVNGSYTPSFAISTPAADVLDVSPGGHTSTSLLVSGAWSSSLSVNFSDSEDYSSIPALIQVSPAVLSIPAGSSPFDLSVQISAAASLAPGEYTVAVTVSEGLVQQTTYLFVDVT